MADPGAPDIREIDDSNHHDNGRAQEVIRTATGDPTAAEDNSTYPETQALINNIDRDLRAHHGEILTKDQVARMLNIGLQDVIQLATNLGIDAEGDLSSQAAASIIATYGIQKKLISKR